MAGWWLGWLSVERLLLVVWFIFMFVVGVFGAPGQFCEPSRNFYGCCSGLTGVLAKVFSIVAAQ